MKKQIIKIILSFAAIVPSFGDVIILPHQPSFGERLGQGFGQGFGDGFNQGMQRAIAIKMEREARFNATYARVQAVLQGYSRSEHDIYMKLLSNSPDLSYSLKTGLIITYDRFRTDRDLIDAKFNALFLQLANELSEKESVSLKKLASLTFYMDPHIPQNQLRNAIKNLNLTPDSLDKITNFTKKYYSERLPIDTQYSEKETALIASLS